MKVCRDLKYLHPILRDFVPNIQRELIIRHDMPFRVFETGRTFERQKELVSKKRSRTLISRHLFDLTTSPPLLATAVDYVYYDMRWSWNIRDMKIKRWWQLFGELVVDTYPELEWGGYWRKFTDYAHFQIKQSVLDEYNDTL